VNEIPPVRLQAAKPGRAPLVRPGISSYQASLAITDGECPLDVHPARWPHIADYERVPTTPAQAHLCTDYPAMRADSFARTISSRQKRMFVLQAELTSVVA
jgi:hypothetical protein